jgi:hypothetical protein
MRNEGKEKSNEQNERKNPNAIAREQNMIYENGRESSM